MLLGSALLARLLYIANLFLCVWRTYKLLQKHRVRSPGATTAGNAGSDAAQQSAWTSDAFLRDADGMLRRWCLLSALSLWESYLEWCTSWVPLYFESKVAVLVLLAFASPDTLFDGFLDPAVTRAHSYLLPRGAGHVLRLGAKAVRACLDACALALPDSELDAWRGGMNGALERVRAELLARKAGATASVAVRAWHPSEEPPSDAATPVATARVHADDDDADADDADARVVDDGAGAAMADEAHAQSAEVARTPLVQRVGAAGAQVVDAVRAALSSAREQPPRGLTEEGILEALGSVGTVDAREVTASGVTARRRY